MQKSTKFNQVSPNSAILYRTELNRTKLYRIEPNLTNIDKSNQINQINQTLPN